MTHETSPIIAKKIVQTKMLFPRSQYPVHRAYIDLFIEHLIKSKCNISKSSIEILSIAIGNLAHVQFKDIESKSNQVNRLESLFTHSLKLKIDALKWTFITGSELSDQSNKAVVEVITSQYNCFLSELEADEKRIEIKKQKAKAKEQKIKAAETQRQLNAENAYLNAKRKIDEASRIDFEDFQIVDIKKGSRVDKLLTRLRKASISAEEMKWLEEVGFSNQLVERQYYIQIAHQHFQNWKQKKLPWELVNASAAYRKAREWKKIKKALDEVYPFKEAKKEKKLKSALLTTYGGVCRDLQEYSRGVELGHEAHKVTPLNFRPCTLLGAIYLSTGEFTLGHEWYDKAKERGFSQAAYDNDIKSVYFRASDNIKCRLKQNLIATGHKYDWLSKP